MGAKQSQEMREALRLAYEGVPVCMAAAVAGVLPGSLYGAIQKLSGRERKRREPTAAEQHAKLVDLIKARRAAWKTRNRSGLRDGGG